MRRAALLILGTLLAGCSSDSDSGPKPEYGSGPFRPVHVTLWQDEPGPASGHLAERRLGDGSVITREHLVALDPLEKDAPAFWADVALETAADGKTARVLVLTGIGEEASSTPRRLELARSSSGRWSRLAPGQKPEELPTLDGCDDAEIAGDFASLSLATRRFDLKPGESRDFDRALVRLPKLDVEKTRRRLTRLDEGTWAWEGLGPDGTPTWRLELRRDSRGALTEATAEGLRRRALRETTVE